jgi:hypothetical protein
MRKFAIVTLTTMIVTTSSAFAGWDWNSVNPVRLLPSPPPMPHLPSLPPMPHPPGIIPPAAQKAVQGAILDPINDTHKAVVTSPFTKQLAANGVGAIPQLLGAAIKSGRDSSGPTTTREKDDGTTSEPSASSSPEKTGKGDANAVDLPPSSDETMSDAFSTAWISSLLEGGANRPSDYSQPINFAMPSGKAEFRLREPQRNDSDPYNISINNSPAADHPASDLPLPTDPEMIGPQVTPNLAK